MNNLKILLKNNLNILLGKFQGKKQRKSTLVALIMLLLGAVGIFSLYTYQAYMMYSGLGVNGLSDLCLFHGFLTALTVIVIIGVMRVSGKNKHSDDDLLLSLPISKKDIIISKTINKYIFDLFFSLLLILPYIIMYLIFTSFSFAILMKGILCIILLPLLSVGISDILNFIITRFFNKVSYGNLLKSLLSVFIFVVIMALMLVKTFFYGTVSVSSMQDYFSDRFFSNMFLNFTLNTNFINSLVVVIVTVLPFVIGLILYSLNYGKSFDGVHGNNKKLKFSKSKSPFRVFMLKEINSYATTPAWITNSIIGPIFIVVLGILFSSMGIEKISSYIGMNLSPELASAVIILMFCALSSTTIISCCSLSLEGKNFWILKSSPINEKSLFLSKALLQVVILEPSIFLSSIILAISLKLSFINFLMIFILPTLNCLILSFSGVLINIFYPVFHYDDEIRVVKQSLASLLTIILGLILSGVLVGIYYAFKSLELQYIFLISVGVYLLILLAVVILLFTLGVKIFRKLQA